MPTFKDLDCDIKICSYLSAESGRGVRLPRWIASEEDTNPKEMDKARIITFAVTSVFRIVRRAKASETPHPLH